MPSNWHLISSPVQLWKPGHLLRAQYYPGKCSCRFGKCTKINNRHITASPLLTPVTPQKQNLCQVSLTLTSIAKFAASSFLYLTGCFVCCIIATWDGYHYKYFLRGRRLKYFFGFFFFLVYKYISNSIILNKSDQWLENNMWYFEIV